MNIVSIGGGPAGLFFAILAREAWPSARFRVFERNQPSDTFGFGVVFSDETLDKVKLADPETYSRIARAFIHWDCIDTFQNGELVRSTGHGFSGLSRRRMLEILSERAIELGVEVHYGRDVQSLDEVADADLILIADGVNSAFREANKEAFRPHIDLRQCRFAWLGADFELEAFTFHFKENEHGLWHVHAYPFERGKSTWIVECDEETYQRSGMKDASEEATVAYMQTLFAPELKGARLLANRSIWRRFPTVRCERWHAGKTVLVGDAAHTAHYSIGSGTKLAMEDAIALRDALLESVGRVSITEALALYEDRRRLDVLKIQRAAQTSLEWFERSRHKMQLKPLPFTFSLMTRSKRITFENLRARDPDLVQAVQTDFSTRAGAPGELPALTPFRVRGLELKNRIVVSPMCQYMAQDGVPNDWHLVHLGSRAVGGAGLVMTEMTNVTPDGRITLGCTGLWNEEQELAFARIVRFAKAHTGAKIGLQLGHAGRKGSAHHPWTGEDRPLTQAEGAYRIFAPSSLPYAPGWPIPEELSRPEMNRLQEAFVVATRRAVRADFDLLEVHMAHGYLLSSFLCPLTNQRADQYGGSLQNRMRFPLEVLRGVREVWPADRPLAVRLSATDWLVGEGQSLEDSIAIARVFREEGVDLIDVSTAGNVRESKPEYGRMYQVPFAEAIRLEAKIPVMAVGAIQDLDQANTIIAAERADLCCLARPHLWNPYFTAHEASRAGSEAFDWPGPYLPGRPRSQ